MITIALDENGDFEGLNGKVEEPVFIAGLLYDDRGDEADTEYERERIVSYYQSVCKTVGVHYPEGLHVNHAENNYQEVSKVKEEVDATLGEFLRYGTYQKKVLSSIPRRGQYTLFMQLKSNQGKRTLQGRELCKMVKDDFASNLYMHMAEDVVSRVIFHNPYCPDIRCVRFDLPTRMAVIDKSLKDKIDEYRQLGYKDYAFAKDEPDYASTKVYLQVANDNNYRAAISREIIASGRIDLDVERMTVNSTYYGGFGSDISAAKRMAFLHIADSICSFLNWGRKGNSPADWLDYFAEKASQLNGSDKNLFFAYDDIDVLFAQAWQSYEKGDYFQALCLAFAGKNSSSKLTAFYQQHWFPLLEQVVCQHANPDALDWTLHHFQQYSYCENLQADCFYYIFMILRRTVAEQMTQGRLDKAAAFAFYDAGISACNHIGQSEMAGKCFRKCKELAPAVDIEMYLRTLNKYAVWRNDVLDFEAAREVAEIIVIYAKELREMRGRLFGNEAAASAAYGRALSQCGQAYAFLHDERAENTFIEALGHFDKDSNDYSITLSYLLHYYIDQKDTKKYDNYAKVYFGGQTDAEKQFDFLMKAGQGSEPRFTLRYAFFVFIKGLYRLHRANLKGQLRTNLLNIENTFRHYGVEDQIAGHPWELIYKYLAILAYQQGKKDIAQAYMYKSASVIRNDGPIVSAILENGKREFSQLIGDKKACAKAEHTMVEKFHATGNDFSIDEIVERLCYMYD